MTKCEEVKMALECAYSFHNRRPVSRKEVLAYTNVRTIDTHLRRLCLREEATRVRIDGRWKYEPVSKDKAPKEQAPLTDQAEDQVSPDLRRQALSYHTAQLRCCDLSELEFHAKCCRFFHNLLK